MTIKVLTSNETRTCKQKNDFDDLREGFIGKEACMRERLHGRKQFVLPLRRHSRKRGSADNHLRGQATLERMCLLLAILGNFD